VPRCANHTMAPPAGCFVLSVRPASQLLLSTSCVLRVRSPRSMETLFAGAVFLVSLSLSLCLLDIARSHSALGQRRAKKKLGHKCGLRKLLTIIAADFAAKNKRRREMRERTLRAHTAIRRGFFCCSSTPPQ